MAFHEILSLSPDSGSHRNESNVQCRIALLMAQRLETKNKTPAFQGGASQPVHDAFGAFLCHALSYLRRQLGSCHMDVTGRSTSCHSQKLFGVTLAGPSRLPPAAPPG